jgi:hypothetical protein
VPLCKTSTKPNQATHLYTQAPIRETDREGGSGGNIELKVEMKPAPAPESESESKPEPEPARQPSKLIEMKGGNFLNREEMKSRLGK